MKNKFSKKRSIRKEPRSNFWFLLAGIAALALLSTLYIWQRMETVSLVREIGKIEKQMSELKTSKEYLAIELTRLGSPQQVCLAAERNLGFKPTEITQQIALFY